MDLEWFAVNFRNAAAVMSLPQRRNAVQQFRWELASCATAPGLARHHAVGALACWGLSHLSDDVRVVVSELVTNALRHGDGTVVLVVTLDAGISPAEVLIEVSDSPRGAGAWGADASGPGEPLATNGRGLMIVARLAHRWGVERTRRRTTVWCRFTAWARGGTVSGDVIRVGGVGERP
ncbi:ATP-binding protein [Streptomyces sp. PTM05]|uniref:ATP-binding protein n=1 Tax=Streptantibioticus parmotrematis TaxID=2873249 RepID=A0ABS7R1X4_9ACTN|nr:ATP-binding protein [Streptantibioticus parmotrematis]MBY8888946.1 ATP-binding protein [Streptantibioticus parmotrematis]